MPHTPAGVSVPITLRLPAGECYRVEVDAADLAGRLVPGRKPPREFGMAPVLVEVRHPGGRHLVPVSAGELTRLLSQARRIDDAPAGRTLRRVSAQNPTSGPGPPDQPAHRLGPTADDPSGSPRRWHRPP
jgi:hypothetical protein